MCRHSSFSAGSSNYQGTSGLRRYQVFRSREAREFLCIAAARDARHALRIARQLFVLTRTAWARPEPVCPHP